MEYFALLIPIISSLICLYIFKHKLIWWEVLLPTVVCVGVIALMKFIMISGLTDDTEYLSEFPIKAVYYEDWNEKVSCRHPRYCTRIVTYSCGTSKSPRTCTRTETYQCGWQHAYDIDYHPDEWREYTNTGHGYSISKSYYNYLKKLWGNENWKDMHRNYHTDDGDSYETYWDKKFQHIIPMTYSRTYSNKPQAARTVFKFRDLDSLELKNVYEYPKIDKNDRQINCINCTKQENTYLEKYNSLIGLNKEIKVFIINFKDKPFSHSELQRVYWRGGNKNELVICVGNDWVNTFSWCDNKTIQVETNELFRNKTLTLTQKMKQLDPIIQKHWKRKNFSDFDYIKIQLTNNQIIWIFIVTFIISGGLLTFGILNEFEQY